MFAGGTCVRHQMIDAVSQGGLHMKQRAVHWARFYTTEDGDGGAVE